MNRRISLLAGSLVALMLTACAPQPPTPEAASPASETALPPLAEAAPGTLTQVTGTVTYRERIALTPDAVLTVEVRELTPEGKPGDILGQQVVTSPGQVPLPFSVALNPQRIRPEASYGLTARITDGGRTFGTPTAVPVLTQGHRSTDVQVLLRSGG